MIEWHQEAVSVAQMTKTARRLAGLLFPGAFIALDGELGAGKTTFTQAVLAALGIERPVQSPTFALLHSYNGRFLVHHLDLYRLQQEEEVLDLGWDELQNGEAVVLVEWMGLFPHLAPTEYLQLSISYAPVGRDYDWAATGAPYESLLKELIRCC
ncbi:MAG: tRNA (adenosine(37)-N6)-threonylcarbamoyltransferase complex ATPase subunit type 1 TsaE [Negativicutes bacterium]|nr:tRNA (adenosine(37)-N6)-threonylcarbamoyltransferase complex ATPase subunit type 1 TsaE [Negativicutes bacterium]